MEKPEEVIVYANTISRYKLLYLSVTNKLLGTTKIQIRKKT
jgi:hypothetical protein